MGLEKIAYYKKLKGLTNKDLAEQSGLPIGTIEKIVSGRTKDPKLETLKAIARVLDCSLDDFDDSEAAVKSIPSAYDDMMLVYTRNKNNLSQEDKIRLARIILSDEEE